MTVSPEHWVDRNGSKETASQQRWDFMEYISPTQGMSFWGYSDNYTSPMILPKTCPKGSIYSMTFAVFFLLSFLTAYAYWVDRLSKRKRRLRLRLYGALSPTQGMSFWGYNDNYASPMILPKTCPHGSNVYFVFALYNLYKLLFSSNYFS